MPHSFFAIQTRSMKNTLIVAADLGLFRAYRVEPSELDNAARLKTVQEFYTVEAHTQRGINITVMERRSAKARGKPQFSSTASDGEQHNMELEKRSRLIKQLGH